MFERDLILLSASPNWEHVRSREAAFKARRIGDIRWIDGIPQKKIEKLSSEADMRRIVFMGNN